jgi:glycosyltransferase involved in cell wall biosynthesis
LHLGEWSITSTPLDAAKGYGMHTASSPLVSIVVPVHQGARTLAECLQSVLAQTYTHWDCTVVENSSSDESPEIAQRFAERDRRIRVVKNGKFVPALANHNAALQQISPASRYCKVVFADDWIYPDCLSEMVSVAEAHRSVGIVGAYWRRGEEAGGIGLEKSKTMLPGREIGRRHFLEDLYVFGSANSLLYRADLVRARQPFFDESNIHADTDVCFDLLMSCDFGFVHKTLTYTRVRPDSLTAQSTDLQTYFAGRLRTLLTHGRTYLTQQEFDSLLERRLSDYYHFLGTNILRGRDRAFWTYHKSQLDALTGFSWARLAAMIARGAVHAVRKPGVVFEMLRKRAKEWFESRPSALHGRDVRQPVQHDVQPRSAGFVLHHDEPLPVACDVVVRDRDS